MNAQPSRSEPWNTVNPATGQVLGTYQPASPQAIEAALEAAQTAQLQWAKVSLPQRANVVKGVLQRLQQHAEPLAKCLSEEVGKPLADAVSADLLTALNGLRFVVQQGPKALQTKLIGGWEPLMFGRVYRQQQVPWGVVALISPWNYPVGTPTDSLAAALLAGNAVVFKPSEKTPATGAYLAQLFQEALAAEGFPVALVQCLQGPGAVGATLVEHPTVKRVFFTGSSPVGRWIQERCAALNKPCSLELGGSDPAIVLEGSSPALVDLATSTILNARFMNAGQTCSATKRVWVHHSVYPLFKAQLSAKLAQLRVGDPLDALTHVGPVIDQKQRQGVLAQLNDPALQGVERSEAALPQELPEGHCYVPPTVLWQCPPHAKVWQEETFGPLLPVRTFEALEEVLADCHANAFGLTASVFGPPAAARALALSLPCGQVGVNDAPTVNYALPQLPWRGWKASGPGVRHSVVGLQEWAQPQVWHTVLPTWLLWPYAPKSPWFFGKGASPWQQRWPLARCMALGFPWGSVLGCLNGGLLRFFASNHTGTKL
jgi:acyl-CoA reductase-like NAD-dependent aldehyde dehydrogenase